MSPFLRWALKKPLLLVFLLGCAHAQQGIENYNFFSNIQMKGNPLSFGGAYRALGDSNAAIVRNPAALAQKKDNVGFAGDYTWFGPTDSNAWSVSGSDYKTIPEFAVGVSYDEDRPRLGGSQAQIRMATVALAKDFLPNFSIGVGVKGYLTSYNSGPGGPDGVDADIGVLFSPSKQISLALTAQNVFQGTRFDNMPFIWGGGLLFDLEPKFRLLFDVEQVISPRGEWVNIYSGGEMTIVEGIYTRAGYGIDSVRDNNFYSLSIATEGPGVLFLFTFAQTLKNISQTYGLSLEFIL